MSMRLLVALPFGLLSIALEASASSCDVKSFNETIGRIHQESMAAQTKVQDLINEKIDELAARQKWTQQQKSQYQMKLLAENGDMQSRAEAFKSMLQTAALLGAAPPEKCKEIERAGIARFNDIHTVASQSLARMLGVVYADVARASR